jgi:REP element-mobilizing transposase RayT
LLRQEPTVLTAEQRKVVAETVGEVCSYRDWQLHALEVRTEHVHVVVSGACRPEVLMTTLKAWCTRRLRGSGLVAGDGKVWSRHGSTRYLWTEGAIDEACRYAVEGQDVEKEAQGAGGAVADGRQQRPAPGEESRRDRSLDD